MRFWQPFITRFLGPLFHYLDRGRQPQTAGRLSLPGLSTPVTVERDRWGIPSLTAASRTDLFLAQGFVHAQDRLWQLELYRLIALGELAAVVGPRGLAFDRLTRTLGFRHLAAATQPLLSEDIAASFQAYTQGINGYLERGRSLPLEFTLLRHTPAPWTQLDCLAIGRLLGWTLSRGWSGEWLRDRLRKAVGEENWTELEARHELPEDQKGDFDLFGQAIAALFGDNGRSATDPRHDVGSSAWAISPRLTSGKRPLLANDIHLPLAAPGFWYLVKQRCTGQEDPAEKFAAAGGLLPGAPFVVVGHNEQIAWGVTMSYADTADLFAERVHEQTYEVEGQSHPLTVREEIIEVKGASPHIEPVRATRHGPLVHELLFPESDPERGGALSLRAASLDPDVILDGLFDLSRAQNWADFQAAGARIEAPSLTLVYADRAGNIGRLLTGRLPRRGLADGRTILPGWRAETAWQGYWPAADLPRSFNPPEGYVIACNQGVGLGPDGPDWGRTWMSGWRLARLEELIAGAAGEIDVDLCGRWQQDVLSLPARRLLKQLSQVTFRDPDAQLCLDLLRQWDGQMTAAGAAPAVYAVFVREIAHLLLAPLASRRDVAAYLGSGPNAGLRPFSDWMGHWPATFLAMLERPDSRWVAGGAGREALVSEALRRTAGVLRERWGERPAVWRWGDLHQAQFRHAFTEHPLAGAIFDLGPWPLPGSGDTLWQAAPAADPPPGEFPVRSAAATYRQVIELGEEVHGRFLTVPGQSARLSSPHRADLIPLWLAGETIPLHSFQPAEKLILAPEKPTANS